MITGCSQKADTPEDPGPVIDDSYLQSDQYRTFQDKVEKEHKEMVDRQTLVQELILKMHEAEGLPEWGLPIHINTERLEHWANAMEPVILRDPGFTGSEAVHNRYIPAGLVRQDSLTVLLFLVRRSTMYKDMQLYMATIRDGQVQDVAPIAEYRYDLSIRSIPEVTIRKDLTITSVMERMTNYPIRQENTSTWHFRVEQNGNIVEINH